LGNFGKILKLKGSVSFWCYNSTQRDLTHADGSERDLSYARVVWTFQMGSEQFCLREEQFSKKFHDLLFREFYFLPNRNYSLPTEKTKMLLRELTHVGVLWEFQLRTSKKRCVKSRILISVCKSPFKVASLDHG